MRHTGEGIEGDGVKFPSLQMPKTMIFMGASWLFREYNRDMRIPCATVVIVHAALYLCMAWRCLHGRYAGIFPGFRGYVIVDSAAYFVRHCWLWLCPNCDHLVPDV